MSQASVLPLGMDAGGTDRQIFEFEASLVYTVKSRPARAIKRLCLLKKRVKLGLENGLMVTGIKEHLSSDPQKNARWVWPVCNSSPRKQSNTSHLLKLWV